MRMLIRHAPARVQRDLESQYDDLIEPLAPIHDSSDSSNPRDHGALYRLSSNEGDSIDSLDSSNDHGRVPHFDLDNVVDIDGRVSPDHERYVAVAEYATLIEYPQGRPNSAGILRGPFVLTCNNAIVRGFIPTLP